MQIPLEEVAQFFRLHQSLMFFVNQRLGVLDRPVATPDAYSGLPPADRIQVHQALLDHRELIDAFVAENPFGFDEPDLEIARSWNALVSGTFYAYRPLKPHMVFLTTTEPVIAYGVVALFSPFEDVIGPYLPVMVKTTLLPFRGKIVYDGLMSAYNVHFGGGVKRRLNESYNEAKEQFGIVTQLPFDPAGARMVEKAPRPAKRATKAGKAGARSTSTSTDKARRAHDEIVRLTDAFCQKHLDDEYAALCRKMADVLARKRPSPLTSGKPESWASGIARVVGWVNFLGDPSQPHHMKMTDIDGAFGVSEATGAAKSRAIRDLLRVNRFEPDWMVPSRMADSTLIWILKVNGLFVDIRDCPREAQVVAFENGLIPYIPADRARG